MPDVPVREQWICPECRAKLAHPHCDRCGKTIVDAVAERVDEGKVKETGP